MRSRLLLLLIIAALLTCRRAEPLPPVILISIDTLRSDHLPMYGYRGVATPALDAFRRDSVLFERAWSHSPLTLPSHATMLTGLLPAQHGVRDNTGFRLPPSVRTLPAILKQNGYATGAAISAFVLRSATGVNAGFDWYDDNVERERGEKSLGAVQRAGGETVAAAQGWVAGHAAQPFFFFLHLYEPHAPYDPPEPYRSRYTSPYDGEIAHTDSIVGGFLEYLKQQGIYERALIILVSDHGEGLGDHGEEEHGIFLYREAIAVPMVIKMPRQSLAGTSSKTPAGLVDLMPTILQVLGIDPTSKMDGVPLLTGKTVQPRQIYSETYYPRFHFGWSDLHSIVDGDDHFIDAPRDELYDLASDPREQKNLIETNRRRYAALREAIAAFEREPAEPSPVSTEEVEKLAALGYIGSGSARSSGPLADPKDKIGTFRELQAAFRLYQQHKDAEALSAFDRLLKDEPDMVDLWDVRSKVLFRLGRTKEAVASAKEALRRNPSATYIAADLANEMLLAGDLEGARQHAELAVRADPAKAREILARVAMARGDLAEAEHEAKAASEAPGNTNAAMYTLARVQQRRADWDGVLKTTDRLRQGRPLRGVATLRGDALARLGREREAEAAFREEIRFFPADVEAYRSLIVLLVTQNRTDEATKMVRELAAASPNARTYNVIAETLRVVGDEQGARYWRAQAGKAR